VRRTVALLLTLVVGCAGVALALPAISTSAPTAPSAPSSAPPWRLVVNDQFNSGGVPRHWVRYHGPYGSGPGNCARPDHATVAKGRLRLLLDHRSSGRCGRDWYSAGMMLTKRYGSVDQKISVRFRIASNGVRGHRIIPMRWPSSGDWPAGGEEDFCEGSRYVGCSTFLHSTDDRKSKYHPVNLGRWHVMTFVRRDFTVRAFIDGRHRWTYRGNRATLPATVKRPVLQQECRHSGCPGGTRGHEVIFIDWIKVWNPRR
jgi:hypothetical protein